MSFPWIRPRTLLPPQPPTPPQGKARRSARPQPTRGERDPADWQRYLAESKAPSDEYGNWVDTSRDYRVGKPGFFGRYAAGMDRNWQMYAAFDAPDVAECSFDAFVRRFERDYFGAPPADLPTDLFLIVRDIDAAYVDLFIRDEWAFNMVRSHLAGQRMKASPFQLKRA